MEDSKEKQKEKSIWRKVIEDMVLREEQGYNSYGKYVTEDNPEDFIQEAYEEILDLVVYLKTVIVQRSKKNG